MVVKEVTISQVKDGFIVRTVDQTQGKQEVSIAPNLGRAVKIARNLFGDVVEAVPEAEFTEIAVEAPAPVLKAKKAA